MMSVPSTLTAFQGMDAFFHASESVINTKNHPMGEMFALKAIEYIAKYLPRAVKDGTDKEARAYVALANTLAGFYMLCTSAHSMEHAMSGFYPKLPHGAGLIMLTHTYYENFADLHVCDSQMIKMAKAMGIEKVESGKDFVNALDKLLHDCNVEDLKMSDYGISYEALEKFPARARKVMGGDFTADPKELNDSEILKIYQKSFR